MIFIIIFMLDALGVGLRLRLRERERNPNLGWSNQNMASRLPGWINDSILSTLWDSLL
jgi:hypothetical protein